MRDGAEVPLRPKARQHAPRFSRETWLEAAMEVLAKEGQARLKVERLAGALSVTKGSFYHHFRDRADFVESLLKYWAEAFTGWVMNEVRKSDGGPSERLLLLMRLIEQGELDRYDIAFRSWAAQDSGIAEAVQKVDVARHGFVRTLFEEMGFEGAELEIRLNVWLVYHSASHTVYTPPPVDGADHLEACHAFFVNGAPTP